MALRGIDAQILVTKSAEFAKEQAKQLRQGQLQTEQAADQIRKQAGQDLKRTPAAGQVEGGRISPDGQGQSGADYYSPGDRERDAEDTPDAPSDLLQLPVERGEKTREKPRAIDITV